MTLIEHELIPLDKSWHIRLGVLDILHGRDSSVKLLQQQIPLSRDLQALVQATDDWNSKRPVHVGESATLYRFLQFASWLYGLNKEFVKIETLNDRKICSNPKIVHYSLEKLLKLDHGTSQWASAAVICGSKERVRNPPFKLKLTYEAVDYWFKQIQKEKPFEPRYDETILKQAEAFVELIKNKSPKFIPEQAEDYCFARAFGYITKREGQKRWKSLKGHESNRIKEMEEALNRAEHSEEIISRDHRVVQAIAMLLACKGKKPHIEYPLCTYKSWPQFLKFLDYAIRMKNY